jgi:eukaryotic-like serine/threonine-protein kinase
MSNELLPDKNLSHYRIISKLGAGGMGEVYLAQDTKLDRKVALKVLPADVASNRDRMERFVREAKAAAALNHPNIAHVYEIGESDSTHYIAMEFIDGSTLRSKIHKEKVPLSKLLNYLNQVAEGLAKAHAVGIVHRDLKPDNIMITRDDYAKVLDFGLAKLVEGQGDGETRRVGDEVETLIAASPGRPVATSPGLIIGTIGYMSPEQASGRIEKIDHRSDIFSFGSILFEAAAGKLAFDGKDALDSLHKIVHAPTPQIRDFNANAPDDLQRIVRRCLAKEPEKRYQSIKEVAIELEELQQELRRKAELDQSVEPKQSGERQATSDQLTAGTADVAGARTVSSAEYVASAIMRYKKGTGIALASFVIVATALALGWSKLSRGKNAPFQSVKIVKLTNTGQVGGASISPDGKYVAYTVREGDQESIWILHVATRSNVQIVSPADVSYHPATFSSDSNYIYYMATAKSLPSAIYQVPVLGGTPKKIIENIQTPISLGPRDQQFAVMRITEQAIQLIIANADGTSERVLTSTPLAGNYFYGPPAWSPDGQVIACSYAVGESAMTLVGVSITDGSMKPLTSRKWIRADHAAWFADGSGLITNVVEQNQPGQTSGQIWYISYPEGSARRISNDTNNYGIGSLSITADASSIVSLQFDAVSNIFISPTDDVTRAKQITQGTGRRDLISSMSWTPAGKLIYSSIASGHPQLWVMNTDGTGNKSLTDSPRDSDAAVSRDGRYIVFTSSRNGPLSIWRMDLDGGNPKQLTAGGPDRNAQISPDGRWVIYDRGFLGNLWKVSIDGGTPMRLTDKLSQYPAISPDGLFIACEYRESDKSPGRIAVIPSEGGSPVKMFDISEEIDLPLRWSADGRAILYATRRGAASKLWSQPLDGGAPKQLGDFSPDQLFSFALSTDGRQLAFARGGVSRDIILITDSK